MKVFFNYMYLKVYPLRGALRIHFKNLSSLQLWVLCDKII